MEESPESRVGLGEETQKGTNTVEQAEPAAEPGNYIARVDLSSAAGPEKALTDYRAAVAREQRVSRKECLSCHHQGAAELHHWAVGFCMLPSDQAASFLQWTSRSNFRLRGEGRNPC